jgi:putative peptidoglycan lipid II flippase
MSMSLRERAPSPPNPPVDVVGRHQRLVRRTALISALTAVSRVLGYVRELLTALLFGDSSPVYDAFVTAWRVPNLFRRLLGEGAASTALQTSMTEADADHGDEAGRALLWEVLRVALYLLLAVCALVMGIAALIPDAMPATGWRWLGDDPSAVRELVLRVTPYVVVICLAALIGGALAVRGHFLATSAGPGLMNLVAIATLVAIGLAFGWTGADPSDGAAGRARHMDMARWFSWGLVLSGVAQLVSMAPEMVRAGLLRRAGASARRAAASGWEVLKASAPLALGAAVYQINVMIDGFMAQGLLTRGGPTTYYFANRIQQLPLALVATAATSAVFPALKALAHKREFGEMRKLHEQAHLAIAFVGLPASFGLFALATPITACLLQHGEFGEAGVARTVSALRMLCFALVPAGAVGLVGRAYFALGDFKTPVRVSAAMLGLNVALNTLFLVVFGLDVAGLALSTALVGWINVLVLMPGFARRLSARAGVAVPRLEDALPRLARMLAAAAACGAAAWGTHAAVAGSPRSVPGLGLAIAAGIAAYAGAAHALRLPEWAAVRERVRRRLGARG